MQHPIFMLDGSSHDGLLVGLLMKGILLLLDDVFLLLYGHLQQMILTGELLKHVVNVHYLINTHLIDQLGTSLSESCRGQGLLLILNVRAHVSNHHSLAVAAQAISEDRGHH
jgi:hypothetical protein